MHQNLQSHYPSFFSKFFFSHIFSCNSRTNGPTLNHSLSTVNKGVLLLSVGFPLQCLTSFLIGKTPYGESLLANRDSCPVWNLKAPDTSPFLLVVEIGHMTKVLPIGCCCLRPRLLTPRDKWIIQCVAFRATESRQGGSKGGGRKASWQK